MQLSDKLSEIGLTGSEAEVYIFLLENGLSHPPRVAKGTGIARTNCYNILKKLKDRNIVLEQERDRKKAYKARSPEVLFDLIRKKEELLKELLPDLEALRGNKQQKPKVAFYDGIDRIKELYYKTLAAEEIYAIGSTRGLWEIFPGFAQEYTAQLSKENIKYYDILTRAAGDRKIFAMREILQDKYESRLLPITHRDFPSDIMVWGNNLALLSFDEEPFGTVISNPLLTQTFFTMFKIMWYALDKPRAPQPIYRSVHR